MQFGETREWSVLGAFNNNQTRTRQKWHASLLTPPNRGQLSTMSRQQWTWFEPCRKCFSTYCYNLGFLQVLQVNTVIHGSLTRKQCIPFDNHTSSSGNGRSSIPPLLSMCQLQCDISCVVRFCFLCFVEKVVNGTTLASIGCIFFIQLICIHNQFGMSGDKGQKTSFVCSAKQFTEEIYRKKETGYRYRVYVLTGYLLLVLYCAHVLVPIIRNTVLTRSTIHTTMVPVSYPSILTKAGMPPDLKIARSPSRWWERLCRVPAEQRAVSTSPVFCMARTTAETICGERISAWRDASFFDSWCTITAALFTTT